MTTSDVLRLSRIQLNHGSGAIPAVGFGTLIPDPVDTKEATKTALTVGFQHLDCAKRYGNEESVGDAMREAFEEGTLQRQDLFVTTKHALEPRLLDDPLVVSMAERFAKTPAQVLLAWGIQRGSAVLTASVTPSRIRENFDVTAIPDSAVQDISERLETRYRFNSVVDGGEPEFAEVPPGSY